MSDNDGRNGYSLRTDLLGMAMGILESKNNRLETNEHFQAENSNQYKRKTVTPYDTEDVIAEAEKLYGFVKNKE